MPIKDLLKHWQRSASMPLSAEQFSVHLPVESAAQIMALTDLFPGRTKEQIISDLLEEALDDVHEHMPYVQGHTVVALDEEGDPIYEDAGLAPRFHKLTEQYAGRLNLSLSED